MVKIVTFNCNSIRNNIDIVRYLFINDIILIQELMLEFSDLDFLNSFDSNFKYVANVKDRESQGICEGRPSKGVAIFWRENMNLEISPLIVDYSIIGITLANQHSKYLLLNVYLPCDMQSSSALYNYRTALANLKVIIDEQNINNILIAGDFNADPNKGRFWRDLYDFMNSLSLVHADRILPQDTFTYLCPSRDSTSWLDHILCSNHVEQSICKIYVDYNKTVFDHFPLNFELDIICNYEELNSSKQSIVNNNSLTNDMVNWNKINNRDVVVIKKIQDQQFNKLNIIYNEVFSCNNVKCTNIDHKTAIDDMLHEMRSVLLSSTDSFTFNKIKSFNIVPGWNDCIKQLYNKARKCFHNGKIWVNQEKVRIFK